MAEGGEKKKVLVVEDDKMSKILVHEILTMNGYETIEARNGAEALRLVREEDPDLVLMDINLPGMDGVTATRLLKAGAGERNVPVLALTASSMEGDEEELKKSGFDGCVPKPIEVKKLVETVKRWLASDKKP